MPNLKIFTPKSEVDAIKNISEFVAFCKTEITIFGPDIDFLKMTWDITDSVNLKGHGNKRVRVNFSTQETSNDPIPKKLEEPFVSFAMSYIRYAQGLNPTKNVGFRVSALRAIEFALRESNSTNAPVLIDGVILNKAAQIISESFAESTAYRVGMQLEMISSFLDQHHLTRAILTWRSPIKRPVDTVRVGKEFDLRRAKKLPSEAALDALPKIFNLATDPKDVIYSSIAAILCSAPDRINEVLLLRENCEVFDKNGAGREVYGLRWWPAKGADPMIKWIIPSMVSVVQTAISNIRELTQAARVIAKWYENNPTKLYLPEHLEHYKNQQLVSFNELSELLWSNCENRGSANAWCAQNDIELIKKSNSYFVNFKDVEKVILNSLPNGFPVLNKEIGINYSEALFLTRLNELHPRKATHNTNISPITINQVNTAFGSRSEHQFESLFDRMGFTEPDGTPIKVTSHQFRHYLNTLAQAGGLSQLDIAKWSGRKDLRQNDVYNHVTTHEMVALIRKAIGNEEKAYGPLASLPKNIPISRDEFARLKIPTAHTTDFGFCVHDYTMAPCEQHADCINCNEHICVKGDEYKSASVKKQLEEARDLLKKADEAHKEGYVGANRWSDHHRKTVKRLEQLVSILDDPAIEIGAVIQLNDVPTVSRMQHAIDGRDGQKISKQIVLNVENLNDEG
jgi:hypothetical protein